MSDRFRPDAALVPLLPPLEQLYWMHQDAIAAGHALRVSIGQRRPAFVLAVNERRNGRR